MAALPAEEGRSKTLIWCFYIKGVGDYDDWVTFFLVASSIASADVIVDPQLSTTASLTGKLTQNDRSLYNDRQWNFHVTMVCEWGI